MAGGEPGRGFSGPVAPRLRFTQRRRRCLRGCLGLRDARSLALPHRGKRIPFLLQRAHGVGGVTLLGLLPLGVPGDLLEPALDGPDGALGPAQPVLELVLLDPRPLQDGAGDDLFLARGGRGGVRALAGRTRFSRGGLGAAGLAQAFAQRGARGFQRLVRLLPAAPEEGALRPAQPDADLAVARGRLRLPRQMRKLLRQRLQEVLDPLEVPLGPAQLQLGLVTALVEAGDPRRLLQDAALGLGLGVDQFGDLSLPHQGGRVGACRGVGKQHLHVPRPHVLAGGLVGAAGLARDPADDVDLHVLVKGGGGGALGVVEVELHLREVPRGPGRGAGEDHILHPAAAHRGGSVLAHDPAQRLEEVGLAAAVRADHARQARRDDQFRRIDEGLESVQAKPGEMQGGGRSLRGVVAGIQPQR